MLKIHGGARTPIIIYNNKDIVRSRCKNAVDQKEFVCGTCGRGYKYKGNLRQHQRFECGVAPQFECVICLRSFTHKSTLKTHLGIVHGKVM